jgi:G patch domain-containing protein 1
MLGEKPVLTASRSVFEYMSQKDLERLKNITQTISTPASQPLPSVPSSAFIPHTEPHIAKAALQGFRPFSGNPEKQARYTAYLQSQASPGSGLSLQPNPGQSTHDFTQELSEYAKSAVIFKPISGAMAGRFVSASITESAPQYQEGFYRPSTGDTIGTEPTPSTSAPEKPEETNSRAYAAKSGMFGAMTREVKVWQPAKLLCKRFGVKDPNPEPESDLTKESNSLPPAAPAPSWTPESAAAGVSVLNSSVDKTGTNEGNSRRGARDLANIGLGEDDHQGEDTLTYERPSMDIFKAIFASDGEDSGDEQDINVEGRGPPGNLEAAETSKTTLPTVPAVTPSPEKIDATTFKPTFIPRSDKQKKSKKKDKKSKSTLVSFQMEEEDDAEFRRKKPRPPKENDKEAKDDQTKQIKAQNGANGSSEVVTPQNKRKRAIDFM